MDYVVHLALEAVGGAAMRCALGACHHKVHRIIAWTCIAVPTTVLTVNLVG